MFFKAFEQSEGICGGASEADEDASLFVAEVFELANFGGIGFSDGVAHGDLAITCDSDLFTTTDRENGGRSDFEFAHSHIVSIGSEEGNRRKF